MSVLNVGIDLAVTGKHQADIRDEKGNRVRSGFSFYGVKEEFDALCEHALKNAPEGTKLRFICEPTAMAWFPLAIYAITNGHEIVRVKAQKAHALREYYSKYKKGDKIDAKVLALMPVVDRDALDEIYLPGRLVYVLDRRCRQREKISKNITAIKARLQSLYHWVMPGLSSCFSDPYSTRAIAFYGKYSNPFKVKKLGLSRLRNFLQNSCRQQMAPELPEKIYQAALASCALYKSSSEQIDFDEIQQEVNCELQLFEANVKVLTQVDDAIKELYEKAHPSKNIETLPGISDILGPVYVGVIGNPTRFSSQSKVRGYSGMVPKQKESGETAKKDQMVHKGNCHAKAVCAVVTHLTSRIHRILKEDRPYELRDTQGNLVSKKEARAIILKNFIVPENVRVRTRNRKQRKKKKGCSSDQVRGIDLIQSSGSARHPYKLY
ncbi:MAG: transposase [Deltaproteobacteria bacterium]|nr:transposase [Deltaproteobacteria bacterium]